MKKNKVIIIGAGPGGLSSGMILASRGFDVHILEKEPQIGGRNSPVKIEGYAFDLGPTFVMLPKVFKEIFSLAKRDLSDYLDFKRIDPMYRLRFQGKKDFYVYNDRLKLKKEIERVFPGEEKNYDLWFKKHIKKFDRTYGCLSVPYEKIYHYLKWKLLKALPVMQLHKSVHGVLKDYFKSEEMMMSMGFQAKYLGMSPWECPGAFSILSYSEHGFGIFHPMGGVYRISEAMAKVINEFGGKVELNTEVSEIIIEKKKVKGVSLSDGRTIQADYVVINADFAYAMSNLVQEKNRSYYTDKKLESMKYSCSTFMLYFGLKKKYEIPHHNIIFGNDYKLNIEEIFQYKGMPSDPSFYIQNPSVIDPTLAPEGKSTIYVLVPVSNLKSKFPWNEKKEEIRNLIVRKIKEKTELKDFDNYIEVEKIITPIDWEKKMNVYKGAVFNLGHNIGQMLYMRPHNRFNEIKGVYLAGGGTHPGSGLPTILESGRIVADIISK